MKKIVKRTAVSLGLIVLCAFAVFAVGCNHNPRPREEESSLAILRLDRSALEMNLYDVHMFRVQYSGSDTIVWKSSDESVVRLDGASAEAVGMGKAVITVTAGDATAECTVNVSDEGLVPVLSVNLPDARLTLSVGDTYKLNPKISFNGSDRQGGQISFAVKGDAVSVESDGTVKALKAGTCTLTVTAEWRDFGSDRLYFEIAVFVI